MKYNKPSLLSVGFIVFDILFYIFLLILDSKNISINFDGFITVIYIFPFLAFLSGVIALIQIKETKENGKLLAQVAMLPLVIVIFFTYLNYISR